MRLNKKFVLIVFVLLAGAVFLSACQQEAVGRKVTKLGGSDSSKSVSSTIPGSETYGGVEEVEVTCACLDKTNCKGTKTTLESGGGWTAIIDCSCCEGHAATPSK